MAARKKTAVKKKEEEKTGSPDSAGKVVTEEVETKEAETESNVPVPPQEQKLSPQAETILEERPLEEEVPLEKSNRKLFTAGLIVVLFIFGITGWVFYLANRFSQKTTKEVVTEVATATPTATPAPTQLERGEITLDVLNGSGVSGAASKAAKTFEDLGYKIGEIGNSDQVTGNKLYVSEDVEGRIDVLLEDVKTELDISSVSGKLTDSTASAQIILGK